MGDELDEPPRPDGAVSKLSLSSAAVAAKVPVIPAAAMTEKSSKINLDMCNCFIPEHRDFCRPRLICPVFISYLIITQSTWTHLSD